MRLPLFDVYRAFPEFDHFSDDRCRGYVRYVWSRYGTGLALGAGALLVCAVTACVVATPFVATFASRSVLPFVEAAGLHVPLQLVEASSLALAYLLIALPALALRDWQYRRVLRRHLVGVRCARCDYSLLGARVIEGHVMCPECAHAFAIASRGLTEQDFMADGDGLPGTPTGVPDEADPPTPELDPAEKEALLRRVGERRSGTEGARELNGGPGERT